VVVEVAAGLIRDEAGRYLVTLRPPGSHLEGLWEFPGGKREGDETLEECLRRELREELDATFVVGDRVETIRWEYPDRTIVLHFYRCRLDAGNIAAKESQVMAWVAPERLPEFDFPPADRAIVDRLRAPRPPGA
jgi:mutator protein MutT